MNSQISRVKCIRSLCLVVYAICIWYERPCLPTRSCFIQVLTIPSGGTVCHQGYYMKSTRLSTEPQLATYRGLKRQLVACIASALNHLSFNAGTCASLSNVGRIASRLAASLSTGICVSGPQIAIIANPVWYMHPGYAPLGGLHHQWRSSQQPDSQPLTCLMSPLLVIK